MTSSRCCQLLEGCHSDFEAHRRFPGADRRKSPWLAGIDPDTGAPRRRVARLSEIPAKARPLVDLLVDQRLLSANITLAQLAQNLTIASRHIKAGN
jgi:hypothetical protein